MQKDATFSPDGKRRFDLVRDWREEIGAPRLTAMFAMLNPSKAGKKDDDPTVRKTVGFARRWGYGRVVLVNINPIVSTDPWELPPWNGIDHENREAIQRWAGESDLVVAAWGGQPAAICRTIAMPELVYEFMKIAHPPIHCIGLTSRGAPLHPSRAPYTAGPVIYNPGE